MSSYCRLTRPVTLTNKDIGDIGLILDVAEGIISLAIFSVAKDIIQFWCLFLSTGSCLYLHRLGTATLGAP